MSTVSDEADALGRALNTLDMKDNDNVEVVLWTTPRGVQLVAWPMRLKVRRQMKQTPGLTGNMVNVLSHRHDH